MGSCIARLAGLPDTVIARATEVLDQLEGDGNPPAKVDKVEHLQLTLFDAAESPMEKELKALDVNVLSPIEALNLLHKWKASSSR